MDLEEKGISIIKKTKELKKRMYKTMIMTICCYVLAQFMYYNGVTSVFPMIEAVLYLLKIDEIVREFIYQSITLFFSVLPLASYVVGTNKLSKIGHEMKELEKEVDKYNDEITLENQKEMIQDIIVRFETLSRSKQMEVLNYIKGDVTLNNDQMYIDINSLGEMSVDYLQREVEDILFPSCVDNQGKGNSLKRTVNNKR